MINGYDHPTRLGVDRWVALIGARHRILARGAPRPMLVVMVGTAVTVDALDTEGRFLGGLILPGFGLMLRALEMGTAGLKAPTGEAVDFPTNTSDALMSGGADAIAGAVERMHRKLLKRCGQEPALHHERRRRREAASISDLPFETVETLIFDGLLQLQAERLAADSSALALEDVARQVLVLRQVGELGVDRGAVEAHRLAGAVRRVEAHLVEQALHHRREAPRADVLGALVDVEGDLGDAPDARRARARASRPRSRAAPGTA